VPHPSEPTFLVVHGLRLKGVSPAPVVARRFVALTGPLLEPCTDWQLRADAPDGAPLLNDHEDNAYDAALVGRLIDLDRTVQPLVAELGSAIERFGRYGGRLAFARSRIESGDADWFTGAMIESYHTGWFELHQDLLATLGIDRFAEERAHAGSH